MKTRNNTFMAGIIFLFAFISVPSSAQDLELKTIEFFSPAVERSTPSLCSKRYWIRRTPHREQSSYTWTHRTMSTGWPGH